MIDLLVDILFVFLVLVALVVTFTRDLFAAVMLLSIFSLLSAALFTIMDAVDVAFTEAAVGAGISTVLMLATLALTTYKEEETRRPKSYTVLPLVIVLLIGSALIYGTLDFPAFGDPNAPVHQHVGGKYIKQSLEDIDIPNVVTSVLASYRSYDTFGETTVVFAAAVGVLLLLGGRRQNISASPLLRPSQRTISSRTAPSHADPSNNEANNDGNGEEA